MEQIVRESAYPQPGSLTPKLRLSPLLIVFTMVVGFTVVTLAVRAIAQYPPAPTDPFFDYADIFPGQPASAIETRTFSCEALYNYNNDLTKDTEPMQELCTFIPPEGRFSRIETTLSGGIIYQLTFFMHDNPLQIGNLEMFFETPARLVFDRMASFYLPESLVVVRTFKYAGRFSRFVAVWSVSFTR